MNEAELAQEFNKELDVLLQGGREPSFSPDQGAMRLAASLAAADFSDESAIKESLRERLAMPEPAPGGLLAYIRALAGSGYARAAFAAALLVVAMLPLARRQPVITVAPPAQAPTVKTARTLPPPPLAALPAAPGPAAAQPGPARSEFFASVPMGRLEGERITEFPIAAAKGQPIITAPGRQVTGAKGSSLILETESAVLTIERRVITAEELFQVRSI